jgi:hypothetical protein
LKDIFNTTTLLESYKATKKITGMFGLNLTGGQLGERKFYNISHETGIKYPNFLSMMVAFPSTPREYFGEEIEPFMQEVVEYILSIEKSFRVFRGKKGNTMQWLKKPEYYGMAFFLLEKSVFVSKIKKSKPDFTGKQKEDFDCSAEVLKLFPVKSQLQLISSKPHHKSSNCFILGGNILRGKSKKRKNLKKRKQSLKTRKKSLKTIKKSLKTIKL